MSIGCLSVTAASDFCLSMRRVKMATILLIYSTTDGHTLKICKRLQGVIEQQAHQVRLVAIDEATLTDLNQFDKIVIGASIRYGRHQPQVYKFINSYKDTLNSKPNAFFSVNIVARKKDKNRPETNPYIKKFLKKSSWQPKQLGVFAGKIDYPRYSFWDRHIIRLIMWITKGPTDPGTVREFTDWTEVDIFAQHISIM